MLPLALILGILGTRTSHLGHAGQGAWVGQGVGDGVATSGFMPEYSFHSSHPPSSPNTMATIDPYFEKNPPPLGTGALFTLAVLAALLAQLVLAALLAQLVLAALLAQLVLAQFVAMALVALAMVLVALTTLFTALFTAWMVEFDIFAAAMPV